MSTQSCKTAIDLDAIEARTPVYGKSSHVDIARSAADVPELIHEVRRLLDECEGHQFNYLTTKDVCTAQVADLLDDNKRLREALENVICCAPQKCAFQCSAEKARAAL